MKPHRQSSAVPEPVQPAKPPSPVAPAAPTQAPPAAAKRARSSSSASSPSLVLGGIGGYTLIDRRASENTDDAQVEADVVPLGRARRPAPWPTSRVQDNQP